MFPRLWLGNLRAVLRQGCDGRWTLAGRARSRLGRSSAGISACAGARAPGSTPQGPTRPAALHRGRVCVLPGGGGGPKAARLRLEAPSVSVAVVSPRPAASRHVWPMRRAGEGPSGRRTCRVAHAADASAAQLLVHGGSFYVEFPSFHRFKASSGFMCGRIQEKQSRLVNREGGETLWAVGGAGRLCPPGCGPGRPPWRWLWPLCFFLGCFST